VKAHGSPSVAGRRGDRRPAGVGRDRAWRRVPAARVGSRARGVRLQVAAAHPGASVNDLTDDQSIDPLTGNAAFSGVLVTVVES